MSFFVYFFKQRTAYEVRISDWSSDVCSSDLSHLAAGDLRFFDGARRFSAVSGSLGASYDLGGHWRIGLNGSRTERSEEHTSELQSLMRISYAVFCLKKKKNKHKYTNKNII